LLTHQTSTVLLITWDFGAQEINNAFQMLEKPASLKTVQYGTQSTCRPAAEKTRQNAALLSEILTPFSSIDKTVT